MATPGGGGRPPDSRATGQVLSYQRKDGLTSWYLRVRAYGARHRITLGTERDGWTEARARIELRNVVAKIQAGIWEPSGSQSLWQKDPTFHEFASSWLTRRKPSFKVRTYEHYAYLLTNHLLPRLAKLRLSQIDYTAIDAYVETKQLESEEDARSDPARRDVCSTRAEAGSALCRTPQSTRRWSCWRDPRRRRTAQASREQPSARKGAATQRAAHARQRARSRRARGPDRRGWRTRSEGHARSARAWRCCARAARPKGERGRRSRDTSAWPSRRRSTTPVGWHAPASVLGARLSPALQVRDCATRSYAGSMFETSTSPTDISASRTRKPSPASARSI